jgi:tetratricopeptide (TPR) repeat protein
MFFPRLRNQAKWAFVFLILVFGGGFVFLGVGSGGIDLGSLLQDAFRNEGGPSTGSLSDAQREVRERPTDAAARRRVADILEKRGRIDEAIVAWSEYTRLRPRDVVALRHLGELQLNQAERYSRQAQLALLAQQEAGVGSAFRPSGGKLGTALEDPLSTALAEKASAAFQEAASKFESAADSAVATYQQIVEVRPKDREAVFSLAQTADTLRQTDVAISAYKKLLTFDLDAATRAQVRERIRTLQQPTAGG